WVPERGLSVKAGFRRREKSPFLKSAGGSDRKPLVVASLHRSSSYEKKKWVLSSPLYNPGIRTGPPKVAPPLLSRNGSFPGPRRLLDQEFAFRLRSRCSQKAPPWYWFFRDFIPQLTSVVCVLPYCAESAPVCSLNWSTASIVAVNSLLLPPFRSKRPMVIPSIRISWL